MSPKIAVVTGGNKGIGYAIVDKLCSVFDGLIYLTARNEQLGLQAVQQLESSNPNASKKVNFHQLDITSVESIHHLAEFIKRNHGGLDILINNAAIAFKTNDITPFGDQAEITAQTNFFGTVNVCNALFPLLRDHARVVNISSRAGMLDSIKNPEIRHNFISPTATIESLSDILNDFIKKAKQDSHQDDGYPNSAYGMSKIALTAVTIIQQRIFDEKPNRDIVVNACCPGYINTDMTSNKGTGTPEQGADTPVYLATLEPHVKSPRGEFVAERKILKWKI
ncbi:unnamed protein product [Rotaria socialis]|uniref:carbonyl reductase (NADPH) n=1 Tax=Rotaria socialis TaxID=392032 RepID=A0A820CIQ1_9BILA|nr:unnamed protein product [Rotaria socialis]CAF3342573.1 unnamed protein product [Rotaria socialis]CAF3497683.1 unnamed protein product [Rotaria socialis]CAF3593398.1 unnamed protein product [Rotaria socialis]CAF3688805.1 unnamed protein product [Rotaria socialis]